MVFILFLFIFLLCLLMGGWEMALITFGCGIGAAILQYLGVGRPKFNKATEDAIRRGEISWQQAYENSLKCGGFTGYQSPEEWEADRAEEKRKQDEASKRILEHNRKHFGMD